MKNKEKPLAEPKRIEITYDEFIKYFNKLVTTITPEDLEQMTSNSYECVKKEENKKGD